LTMLRDEGQKLHKSGNAGKKMVGAGHYIAAIPDPPPVVFS